MYIIHIKCIFNDIITSRHVKPLALLVSTKLVIHTFLALFLALSPGLMSSIIISLQSSHTVTTVPGLAVICVAASAGLCWLGVRKGVTLILWRHLPHTACRHSSHRLERLNKLNRVLRHWKQILDFSMSLPIVPSNGSASMSAFTWARLERGVTYIYYQFYKIG